MVWGGLRYFDGATAEIEQHEQIKIVASHGSLCKRIKNEKENIINSAMWKRHGM